MPYIIRPRRVRSVLAALGAAGFICLAPAAASAACPTEHSSQLLSQFGDHASYFQLQGSSFEEGAPGWSLSNAEVTEEGPEGEGALVINPGGVAVSPAFCVSSEDPTFRFFARQLSGGWLGQLSVTLRWYNHGLRHEVPASFALSGSDSWSLTPMMGLARALSAVWMPGSTLQVSLVFRPLNGSSWAIGNVLIDPYSR